MPSGARTHDLDLTNRTGLRENRAMAVHPLVGVAGLIEAPDNRLEPGASATL
jgi:hypothetical protein